MNTGSHARSENSTTASRSDSWNGRISNPRITAWGAYPCTQTSLSGRGWLGAALGKRSPQTGVSSVRSRRRLAGESTRRRNRRLRRREAAASYTVELRRLLVSVRGRRACRAGGVSGRGRVGAPRGRSRANASPARRASGVELGDSPESFYDEARSTCTKSPRAGALRPVLSVTPSSWAGTRRSRARRRPQLRGGRRRDSRA